jgi:hypothetical protein
MDDSNGYRGDASDMIFATDRLSRQLGGDASSTRQRETLGSQGETLGTMEGHGSLHAFKRSVERNLTRSVGTRAGWLGDGSTLAGSLELTEDQLSSMCVELWTTEQQESSGDLAMFAATAGVAALRGLEHTPLSLLNERIERHDLGRLAPGAGRRLAEDLDSERPPAGNAGTPEAEGRPEDGRWGAGRGRRLECRATTAPAHGPARSADDRGDGGLPELMGGEGMATARAIAMPRGAGRGGGLESAATAGPAHSVELIREAEQALALSYIKILGTLNVADLFSKPLVGKAFKLMRGMALGLTEK